MCVSRVNFLLQGGNVTSNYAALYATPADPNFPDEGPVYYDGVRTRCNLFIEPLTK